MKLVVSSLVVSMLLLGRAFVAGRVDACFDAGNTCVDATANARMDPNPSKDPSNMKGRLPPWGVEPRFLTQEEMDHLVESNLSSPYNYRIDRKIHSAHVNGNLVSKLHEAGGYGPFPKSSSVAQHGTIVPVTTLKHTSRRHLDQGIPAGSKVCLVFLNTNEDAHFDIGTESVPIVAGTLVHFQGDKVPHNTVVNSGTVDFLGPFSLESMDIVGNDISGAPANDQCSDATDLPLGGTFLGDTSQSTDYSDIPECGNGAEASRKLWYKFVGTGTDIRFTTDLPGYSFDTVLAVYTGDCANLSCVGADDDSGSNYHNLSSELVTNTVQGQDYFLVVRAFHYNSGGGFEVGVFLPDGVTLPPEAIPTPAPMTPNPTPDPTPNPTPEPTPAPITPHPSSAPSMAPTKCHVVNDDCTAEGSFLRTIPDAEQGTCCEGLVCVRQGGQGPKCLYQCLDDGERPCQAGNSATVIEIARVGELAFHNSLGVCCPGLVCFLADTANVCVPEPTPAPTHEPTSDPTPDPTPTPTPEPTPAPMTQAPSPQPSMAPSMCNDVTNQCSAVGAFLRTIPDPAQGTCCDGLFCVRPEGLENPSCLHQCVSDEPSDGGARQVCDSTASEVGMVESVGRLTFSDKPGICCPGLVCREVTTGVFCFPEPTPAPSPAPTPDPTRQPSSSPSVDPTATPCDARNVECEFEFDLRGLPDATQGSCCGGLVCVRDGDDEPPTCQVPQMSDEFEECSLIDESAPKCHPHLVCSETDNGNFCLSEPSAIPSVEPSVFPTSVPSVTPSWTPSAKPSFAPSPQPSGAPSQKPTRIPTNAPIPPRECTMLNDMLGEGFGGFIKGIPLLGELVDWVVCLFD